MCKGLSRGTAVGRTMSRQLLRSATSIGANIEEGQAGQSRRDFIHKYSLARKEARETHYWLRIIRASKLAAEGDVGHLAEECEELLKIVTAIIKKAGRPVREAGKVGVGEGEIEG